MDATIDVIGAGGIGCAIGYAVAAAGDPVRFVDVNPRKIEAGRRGGVSVEGRPPLPAAFVHFDDWVPTNEALTFLCTKCYDNAAVLAKIGGRDVLPVQNGFDPLLDARDHDLEAIASFVSECEPDRPHTRITRGGDLHLGGRRNGKPVHFGDTTWKLARYWLATARLFRVVPVGTIEPFKHAKLMYNAAISPLAAAAGIDNGQLLSVPAARRLFFALLQENYRILAAAGVPLGKVGPFRPPTVAWILRRKWLAGLMAKGFEPSLRGTYCSMAGDIETGRTEMDNYNGHLIRLADAAGVPCPLNRAVYDTVTRMAAERIRPHRGVLDQLRAA